MVDQVLHSLSQFLPESILIAGLCLGIIADLIFRKKPQIVGFLGVFALLMSGWCVTMQVGTSVSAFSGMIVVDPFAVFFKMIVIVTTLFIFLFSHFSVEVRSTVKRMGEYYALLLAMALGMMLMAGAANLLMMVLALELTSLSSYILAGYTKEAPDSSEASLKYILYGAVSTGLMLYGISILFGLTGSTDLFGINRALAAAPANYTALLIATILMLAGFGYKISAVPFHFWTPDVYEGAPITITAFLSVASKAAGFAMMIRFLKSAFIDTAVTGLPPGMWVSLFQFEWNNLVAILSVLTMTLGNLVAVWQDNLKRLLAYSSIAHAGYMLMGLVVLSDKGLAAILIYFVVYLFMNLGAFCVVMLVANKTGSEHIDSYKGLGFRSPMIAVAMVIFLISLTGLPPTAGFIGKLYLFSALLDARWIWLAIVGAINSVISLYYYVRVIRNMFLRDAETNAAPITFSFSSYLLLFTLLVPTLVLGVYFGPIVDWANASVAMFGLR